MCVHVCTCACALCWDNTILSHTFSTRMPFSFLLLFEHLVLMTPWQERESCLFQVWDKQYFLVLAHKLV